MCQAKTCQKQCLCRCWHLYVGCCIYSCPRLDLCAASQYWHATQSTHAAGMHIHLHCDCSVVFVPWSRNYNCFDSAGVCITACTLIVFFLRVRSKWNSGTATTSAKLSLHSFKIASVNTQAGARHTRQGKRERQ